MAGIAAALALILMVAASPAVQGVQHTVGGDSHWTLGVNYASWAAGQKFNVGDTLLFIYDSTHRVDELNEGDYNSCSFDAPINSHNDGNTSISLAKAGKMYFACPTSGHCAGGMKFTITVAASTTPAPSGSPPATPSTPSPPSGSTTPSTTAPPPPTTPSGTAPAPSGAASIVISLKMFGVTALSAALLVAILG